MRWRIHRPLRCIEALIVAQDPQQVDYAPIVSDIHDFIYLDIERIRSFVAQAGGGVPTERSGTSEHQTGGEATAGGALPFGLARIQGQTDYHYVRSATETKSVQDAIFKEFIAAIRPVDVSLLPWDDPVAPPDGSLIYVHGHVKLIDYQASLDAIKAFPKVLSGFERFSRASSGQAPVQARARHAQAGGIQKGQADSLGPLIEGLSIMSGTKLTDFVRIKIVPDLEQPTHAFIGDGSRENFRYPSALLSTLYPGGLAEGWHAVGLVHRAPILSLPGSEDPETMGEMLEALLDKMQELEAFRQAAKPPAVAITPLAIYRLLVSE